VFAEVVARAPDAVAISADSRTLTYRELDERAERLADRLVTAGAGPDRPVGLCLRRDPDTVVAMLAVVKAGAAYLPLDPDYPADRLAYMIGDAGVRLLVTRGELAPQLPDTDVLVIDLDQPTRPADRRARAALAPDHLAYVIYTSGSTGRPKGVMISHRAVLRLVLGGGFTSVGPRTWSRTWPRSRSTRPPSRSGPRCCAAPGWPCTRPPPPPRPNWPRS
jgi:non-ribosomal peptide synthetase component F